jgi:3-hydroxyisobutyrate dehydrogenase-like beta-hydroxyacid dehydrogenase
MAEQIGFLGPGLMGKGIVLNLLKKGFPVKVLEHRAGLNLQDLTAAGATVTTSLDEVGKACSRVILCVPSFKKLTIR